VNSATAQALEEHTLWGHTGNRHNCWKTLNSVAVCSLVVDLHGLYPLGGPLSRDVRCIYYPVPLLQSLDLLGLSYPRVTIWCHARYLLIKIVPPRGWYARLLSCSWGSFCVLIILGGGLYCTYRWRALPPPPLGHGACQLVHMGSLNYSTFCLCLCPYL